MAGDVLAMTRYAETAPGVLLIADGDAAAERARHAAENAALRICGVERVADAIERLDRQAAVDAVLLEVDADPGAALDRLLERISADSGALRYGAVVVAPQDLIDPVATRVAGEVHHLCAPDDSERVAALAVAARRIPQFREAVRSGNGPSLQELSAEVGRIASLLAALSDRQEDALLIGGMDASSSGPPLDPAVFRRMIRARRMRERFLHPGLFADPAWDMLLDLMAARLEGTRVAVSSLCIAAAVPPTTALRWIRTLTDHGLFIRRADPEDGRRIFIELSDEAARAMEGWYRATAKLLEPIEAKD